MRSYIPKIDGVLKETVKTYTSKQKVDNVFIERAERGAKIHIN